jgi:DNA-binding NtrC family response regulator
MAESKFPFAPVLIIDDEEAILAASEVALALAGISNIVMCQNSADVELLLKETRFSAITLDLIMPKVSGQELLPLIRDIQPDASIIIVTGTNDAETAIDLMKRGIFDYLIKPVDKDRLVTSVQRAIENWEIRAENQALRERLLVGKPTFSTAFDHILTVSDSMKGIFGYIEAIAPTSLPVIITGETGVGKELLARSVHLASCRTGAFVPVNTAGLDDQLFSDTLFGHRKGAFTDAMSERKGMIARAAGGTLFLDEIGDLPPESQTKLLRLIQEREYYPLGSDAPERTDARLVFATNKDLDKMVAIGHFRQDLYYRLRSHHVVVPPLRDRPEDIPMLVDFFLDRAAEETRKPRPTPPKEIYDHLAHYGFPGNVRELQGLIYDAVVRHQSGVLSLKHFEEVFNGSVIALSDTEIERESNSGGFFASMKTLPRLKIAVDDLILEAMKRARGNQTIAARLLGMTRTALNKRLSRDDHSEEL